MEKTSKKALKYSYKPLLIKSIKFDISKNKLNNK